MPIYMDVHIVRGAVARAVAIAHSRDLMLQEQHECKCMTYWFDEERESIFCLIEAPNKDAVVEMHNEAHGLLPHKIIEVSSNLVEAFLGRIYDPEDAEITKDGLKVFSDPSFRILLVTKTDDPILLQHRLGAEEAEELLSRLNHIIRKNIAHFSGSEVEGEGSGIIVSFTSAAKAVHCALAVQKELSATDAERIGFRISLNSGEPIEEGNRLFGATIQLAQHFCAAARRSQITISNSVKALVAKDFPQKSNGLLVTLAPQDEKFLHCLYQKLEESWQDPHFNVDDYCHALAMSKSQLYRKTIALTGQSPNLLLKEYRLEKARELMKKQFYSIAQITFDSGFTSPSYFTKCFKKKYGLLPIHYMEMLHS